MAQNENIADSGIQTHYMSATEPQFHPTFVLCKLPTVLLSNTKFACYGQNQKREKTPTTELNIFLSNFFFRWKITQTKNFGQPIDFMVQ